MPFNRASSPLLVIFVAFVIVALTRATPARGDGDDAATPPDFASLRLQPLPIQQWLSEDKVTIVSSPHDRGDIKNVFDGNASTLLRSAAVNPQQTTIQFDGTVSIAATRVQISHHVGRWKMEAMVWLQDATAPTKFEIVPWTNAGDGENNEIIFPRNLAVSQVTLTAQRTSGDDYVHLNEWELLTEIKEPQAPN